MMMVHLKRHGVSRLSSSKRHVVDNFFFFGIHGPVLMVCRRLITLPVVLVNSRIQANPLKFTAFEGSLFFCFSTSFGVEHKPTFLRSRFKR